MKLLIYSLLAGCIFFLGEGCGMQHKIAKAYEYAANTNPVTAKDSLNGRKIAHKFTSNEKPKTIPGKIIKQPYPVFKTKKVLDAEAAQAIADSLGIVHAQELNDIVDGCLADAKKAYQKGLKDGATAGYNKRNKELQSDSIETKTPDTTIIPDPETSLDLSDCQANLRAAQALNIAQDAQIKIYKKQSADRFWIILILGAGFLTSLFFNVKKSITKINLPK